ncbi:MAG TPA: hypothetical protein VI756_06695, partial [Blastocatellia bacterium]
MRATRAIFLCALCSAAALAQTTGAINGTVRVNAEDRPGVPNAPVVAKDTATGASYSAHSAANGT